MYEAVGMQGRLFVDDGWNPRGILVRIGLQLAAFYASYLTSLVLLALTVGTSLQADYVWSSRQVSVLTSFGWAGIVSWVAADVVSCWALPYTAQRAKRCWDYSATVLFLHILLSSAYDAFPTHWDWWIMAVMSFIITTTLGEWLCMRVEMADISVDTILHRPAGSAASSQPRNNASYSAAAPSSSEHEGNVRSNTNKYGSAPAGRSSSLDRDRYESAGTHAEIEASPLLRGRSSDAGAERGSHTDLGSMYIPAPALHEQAAAPHTPARVSTVPGTGVTATPAEDGPTHAAAASPQSKAASLSQLFSAASMASGVGPPGSGGSRQRGGKLA